MIIKTAVRYVVRISNGVIIEDSDFKNVYRAALCELRCEYGHSLHFNCGHADIDLCVVTDVYRGSKCTSGRIVLRSVCGLNIYSMDDVTYVLVKGKVLNDVSGI